MLIFYNIALKFYYILIWFASFFNKKAKLWIVGRKNWAQKIIVNPNTDKVWFHFASLGEFEQGKPILQSVRKQYPDKEIVITFFSPSGYEIRKNSNLGDYILYLPNDSRKNALKFLELFKPEVAIFNKYEYWYHYFKILHQKHIPVYVTSAIFRPNQIFFKWYGSLHREILTYVTHFFVQNTESGELLKTLNHHNYTICGDTRFDTVLDLAKNKKDFPLIEEFKNNHKLIIAGSTWPKDEDLISNYIKNLDENWKIIFAPHEISEDKISNLEKTLSIKSLRYSKVSNDKSLLTTNCRCIIIDNIGMLSSLYAYGDFAYIGGGFGAGIHNTLEAAAWGLPVVFGSNYHQFNEAKELISKGGGFSIDNQGELNKVFGMLVHQDDKRTNAGSIAKEYVAQNTGATEVIMHTIFKK